VALGCCIEGLVAEAPFKDLLIVTSPHSPSFCSRPVSVGPPISSQQFFSYSFLLLGGWVLLRRGGRPYDTTEALAHRSIILSPQGGYIVARLGDPTYQAFKCFSILLLPSNRVYLLLCNEHKSVRVVRPAIRLGYVKSASV